MSLHSLTIEAMFPDLNLISKVSVNFTGCSGKSEDKTLSCGGDNNECVLVLAENGGNELAYALNCRGIVNGSLITVHCDPNFNTSSFLCAFDHSHPQPCKC